MKANKDVDVLHVEEITLALVDAMSFKENLKKLNDFSEWRDSKPEKIN
jgi:hypothetical protein